MVLMCAFAGLMAKAQYKVYVTPVVPLHTAVSGHFAGLHNGMLRTWGGCNFPDLPLADGGQKRFYPVAYGACVPVSQGTVCVGGTADGVTSIAEVTMERNVTYRKTQASQWDFDRGARAFFPSLPKGLHNLGGAFWDGYVYVAGGQSDSVPNFDVYRLEWPNGKAWEKVGEMPGDARIQPVVTIQRNPWGAGLYVMGGFSPATPSAKGYVHRDGLCMDLRTQEWRRLEWKDKDVTELPTVGTCVRTEGATTILVEGGVDAAVFTDAINTPQLAATGYFRHDASWYKFQPNLLAYNTFTDSWSVIPGHPSLARAGATWTKIGDFWFLAGGELMPGIRTSDVSCVEVVRTRGFRTEGLLVVCGVALCFVLLVVGMKRRSASADVPACRWLQSLSLLATLCGGWFMWLLPTLVYLHAGVVPLLLSGIAYVWCTSRLLRRRLRKPEVNAPSLWTRLLAVCGIAWWLFVPAFLLSQATGYPLWSYALLTAVVSVLLVLCGKRSILWSNLLQLAFLLVAVVAVTGMALCQGWTGSTSLVSALADAQGLYACGSVHPLWVGFVLFSLCLLPAAMYVPMPAAGGAALSGYRWMGGLCVVLCLVMGMAMYGCIRMNGVGADMSLDAVYAILPSFMASASSPWLSGLLVGTLLSASWCAVTRLLGRLW